MKETINISETSVNSYHAARHNIQGNIHLEGKISFGSGLQPDLASHKYGLRLEVFTERKISIVIFRDLTPFSHMNGYQCFRGMYCFHPQD